jgi:hypothetical protein
MSSLSDFLPPDKYRELVEEIGLHVESFRLLINKESRSWQEFFAVLKPPQLNFKHVEQRMTTNLVHYRVNYMVICLVVYVLQILFHPVLLVALLAVMAFCFYSVFILRKPLILGESIIINENGVKVLTVCVSIIFLALVGSLEQLLWGSIYSLIICTLHMLLRPRSVTSKTNLMYEQMRVTNGGFSWGAGGGGNVPGDALSDNADKMEAGVISQSGSASVSASSSSNTPSSQPLLSSLGAAPKKD